MTYFPSHTGEVEVHSQAAFDSAVQALNVKNEFKLEAENLEAKVWADDHLPMYVWTTNPAATYGNLGFGHLAPAGGVAFEVIGGHLSAQELIEGPHTPPAGLIHTQGDLLAEIQARANNYIGAGADYIADAQQIFGNSRAFAESAHSVVVEDYRSTSFISCTTTPTTT